MSSSEPRSRRAALASALASLVAAGLGGCGFALRRPPQMSFASVALTGFAAHSPLRHELQRQLEQQLKVLDTPDRADVVLQALVDARERSIVASTSAAQVREVQLRLRFTFRAQTPAGRELMPRAELLVARDLSYQESAALAKEHEEAELFRDMQDEMVAQVLRRLAAVHV
jgi:LPS-assembly lipoprotein